MRRCVRSPVRSAAFPTRSPKNGEELLRRATRKRNSSLRVDAPLRIVEFSAPVLGLKLRPEPKRRWHRLDNCSSFSFGSAARCRSIHAGESPIEISVVCSGRKVFRFLEHCVEDFDLSD